MKLNKILMALSAMAIVGCSSEDFNDPSVTQAIDDSRLIQLDENFVLAGVGEVDNTTRTHWDWEGEAGKSALINKFLPIYKTDAKFEGTIDKDAVLEAQAVGLCWLGQTPGAKVYTNYEFYHFGWLKTGATEATFDCGKLTNGAQYDEITAKGSTAGQEAVETKFAYAPGVTKDFEIGKLNYNSGVYKTDNKAIFGGQYIVYYPYNKDFKDAGTIPATAETNWENVPTSLDAPELGKATFRYSAPVKIEGGSQASDFGLYNLSSLVQLKVFAPADDKALGRKVDQIVLYSKSEQLLKQANLAADQIVAGQKGADLYASTEGTEGTKTISAKFAAGQEVTLAVKASAAKGAFITVLPTTVSDLVVLVHSTDKDGKDGKWATIDKANTVFKAGSAKVLELSVTAADLKADYIAVDDASLRTALDEANKVAGEKNPRTITVIGDIELKSKLDIPAAYANCEHITIKGDDIIVPEGVDLTLKNNMESNVRVLGKSCCSDAEFGGRLYVNGGKLGNVTMEETKNKTANEKTNPKVIFQNEAAEIVAGKTFDVQAGNVIVNAAVQHKGNIQIAKDAKVTVQKKGDLNFMGSKVTNDGTIEVEKNGNFDMTDANGNATATDGQRMTNNGKFIHNVDAGVGTAVQSMKQNGEYRCKVDDQIKLDDAFLQWTACSVIEIVGTAPAKGYNLGTAANIKPAAYKHNDKFIDIEVNTDDETTFTNPTPDDKVIQIGNLTVTKGGLNIDYTNTVEKKTDSRTLTVNGDMVVKANTTITDSKKINVNENLIVSAGKLTYKGAKANKDGLAVTKDIKVSGATFDAGEAAADVDALNITCANFYLEKKATAIFGNRTDGAAQNMVVNGTISNPDGCTFNIVAANQNGKGSVLAWVTCKKLEVGGTFTNSRPRVE